MRSSLGGESVSYEGRSTSLVRHSSLDRIAKSQIVKVPVRHESVIGLFQPQDPVTGRLGAVVYLDGWLIFTCAGHEAFYALCFDSRLG